MYYFEKVAKEVKKTDNADETNKYIKTTTGGSLVGFGGDIGLKAEPLLFKRLSDEDKKEYIKNVVDKYEPGTTIHVNKNNLGINRAEHRYGSNPRINISEDRDFTFLHELGHADNALKRHNKLHNKNKQKGLVSKNYGEILKNHNEIYKKFEAKQRNLENELNVLKKRVASTPFKKNKKEMNDRIRQIGKELDKINNNIDFKIAGKAYYEDFEDALDSYWKKNHIKKNIAEGINTGTLAVYSKTFRDKVKETNNGKSKTVDKVINTIEDNPAATAALMGVVKDLPQLIEENRASNKALANIIKKYGVKKGLIKGLPMYIAQQSGYIGGSVLKEGTNAMAVSMVDQLFREAKKANNNKDKKQLEKKASYKEIIYKEASVTNKEGKGDKEDMIKSLATGLVGAGMIYASKDRVLGQKTLYHGTSSKNWGNIENEGLKVSKGGNGASSLINNKGYIDDSKGKVHLTGRKTKARMYAGLDKAMESVKDAPEVQRFNKLREKYIKPGAEHPVFESAKDMKEYSKANEEANKRIFTEALKSKNQGKVVKIKMNYDKYKKMEVDPDEVGGLIMREFSDEIKSKKGKALLESIAKHQASRANFDIGKDEIVGLHKTSKRLKNTAKNLPSYIKNNKGRFGSGVAMAALGTAMLGKSLEKNKK